MNLEYFISYLFSNCFQYGAVPMANHRKYYKGESGGFPQVRAMVNLVSPCMLVVHLCSNYALTDLLCGLCKSI
jgi:hypothetical protein